VTESEILRRSYPAELEAGDGRTLEGLAVPYGVAADVEDFGRRYRETFEPGAFQRATRAANRLELLVEHRDDGPIDAVGLGVAFEERSEGLFGSWRIYDGPIGDHVLERVKGGALRGLSIGFRPLGPGRRLEDGTLVRTACHLDEVSLTRSPAYAKALVSAVRSAPEPELEELLRPTEHDEELEERLRKLGLR
jgi:Escherichia/Staphylococcus phage prohead protease